MPASKVVSVPVAAACGVMAAPLFISPSVQQPTSQRMVGSDSVVTSAEQVQVQVQVQAPTTQSSWPALALGAVGITAAAGAAARRRSTATARRAFDATKELGVQAPVQFWDPLGFCASGTEADFKRRRAVEIKHGRISMLACIGYIVPEYVRFPGYLSPSQDLRFEDMPNGFAAFSKVPLLGWAQIVIFAGMMEGRFLSAQTEPGNFGFGNLGACGLLGPVKDPQKRAEKLNAEIANGRLAMFAIIGLFFQNGVTGTTGPELYGFGENSGVVIFKYLAPSLAVFGLGGETFRKGPDEKFLKYFPRKDYYGKDKRM